MEKNDMKSIEELKDLKGKRALVRIDTDVEIEGGRVVDDYRLKAALPTIRLLVRGGARVTLIGHLGRPEGRVNEKMRLAPVARRLAQLLVPGSHLKTVKPDNTSDSPVWDRLYMLAKNVALLENLRFDPGEEANEAEFVRMLAHDHDLFVNESFATAHRAAASTVGIAKKLPSYAGLRLIDELAHLSLLTTSAERPFVLIVGGAKVPEKLGLLDTLLPKVDHVLTGGVVANMLLKTTGNLDIKKSKVEADFMDEAEALMTGRQAAKIHLPTDVIWGKGVEEDMILDLGYSATLVYQQILKDAKTVFWAGSLGKAEESAYATSTKAIAKFLAEDNSKVVMIGGGDTATALAKFKLLNKMSFVSTGGGAALEYLAGKKLPGVDAL
jgi:phosphoglycerate kinase